MPDKAWLDWAEPAALENLRFHLEGAEVLGRESNTTLAFIVTGAGVSLSYALGGTLATMPVAVYALEALALALFVCAAFLLRYCLRVREIYPPTNEPDNLELKGRSLETLRWSELGAIQLRINKTQKRNRTAAEWLNRVRLAALIAAGVATLVVLAAAICHGESAAAARSAAASLVLPSSSHLS